MPHVPAGPGRRAERTTQPAAGNVESTLRLDGFPARITGSGRSGPGHPARPYPRVPPSADALGDLHPRRSRQSPGHLPRPRGGDGRHARAPTHSPDRLQLGPGEELAARLERFADASQAWGKVAAAVRPCARRPSSSTTRAAGPASWSGPSSWPVWATGAAARVAAPPWKANRSGRVVVWAWAAGEMARWVVQRRLRSGRPRSVRAERNPCAARVTPAPLGVRGWFWWGGRRRSISRIRRCRCPDSYGCVGGPCWKTTSNRAG